MTGQSWLREPRVLTPQIVSAVRSPLHRAPTRDQSGVVAAEDTQVITHQDQVKGGVIVS